MSSRIIDLCRAIDQLPSKSSEIVSRLSQALKEINSIPFIVSSELFGANVIFCKKREYRSHSFKLKTHFYLSDFDASLNRKYFVAHHVQLDDDFLVMAIQYDDTTRHICPDNFAHFREFRKGGLCDTSQLSHAINEDHEMTAVVRDENKEGESSKIVIKSSKTYQVLYGEEEKKFAKIDTSDGFMS